jgi:lipopolysaccharide export system permease protein
VPLLAIAHTLLAMALVLTFGNVTGRRGGLSSFVIIGIPAAHIVYLVALESLLRMSAWFALLLLALLLLEIGLSLWLIARLSYSPNPRRAELPAIPGYAAPVARGAVSPMEAR